MLKQPDGSFAPASWDEAFAEIDRRLAAAAGRARPRRRGALHRQPGRARHGRPALRPRPRQGARHAQHLHAPAPIDQRPKEIASGLMFGGSLTIADPRRRPHRPPADPRRQPAGLERQPADRARPARAAARDPGARRQGRGRRPAPLAHRRGRRRPPLHPARHRRAPAVRARPHPLRRGARDARPARRAVRRDGGGRGAGAGLHARGRRRGHRHRGRGDPRHGARAGRRRARRGLRPHRHDDASSARCLVARLRAERLTGNLDREGGAMFPRAAAGARNTQGEPGRGRGIRLGRWTSRVRGLPESLGELPAACLAEEIETPGEGQVRVLITLAGNPARSTPNSRPARGGARHARPLRRVRHLPQRDDAPRRRHPAAAVAAAALALRHRLLPAVRAQRGELLARRAAARAGPAGRVADAAAARGRGRRPGARRRHRRLRPRRGRRGAAPRGA